MNIILQTFLIIITIITLCSIIYCIVRNKMNIHYAMIWIIWGISLVVIAIYPSIINTLTFILGIYAPSNTIFLINFVFIYALCFYIYIKISRHNEDIINLNYEIANLKNKIEQMENENKSK